MSDGYNGWSNYETWSWSLWISCDQGWSENTDKAATEFLEEHDGSTDETRHSLADYLEMEADEMMTDVDLSGPLADLLGAAVQSIDWMEIAEAYIEIARENAEL